MESITQRPRLRKRGTLYSSDKLLQAICVALSVMAEVFFLYLRKRVQGGDEALDEPPAAVDIRRAGSFSPEHDVTLPSR